MTLRQEVHFDADPATIYAALLRSEHHSAFTGAPAELGAAAGAPWSAYGGAISGHLLELVPDQRIVQSWRAGNWPAGKHSVVHVELTAADGGTTLTLEHAGFPDGEQGHLEAGWHERYWTPLRTWLTT